MMTPKIREIKEAISNIFSKRFTTKFPFEVYEPVETYRGKPLFNPEKCVGCGACVQVCPAKAIDMVDDLVEKVRVLTVKYTDCIYCGQCQEKCIVEDGIVQTTDFTTATFDRSEERNYNCIEKELVFCERCGAIITTVDHLKWLIKRLGAYTYGNPNLVLIKLTDLGYSFPEMRPREIIRREELFKLLCPKCRHLVVVEDAFK
ncbi:MULTISPECIES: 4Fe-4S binding protein [Kosmotoga]|uniref:4Fe-4S ferredoxin iron-sulfur binding domain protein n=2 Tax=Kosmotoga TaxID=651456 RepID=C5CEU7_KOSOT|nr:MULTISPECIES: 4Fe-4S binding protein [Kosmotoga]ACR79281.1 4Fe-4S ferredoxin iron-sulfur binding domain protein [Kosmotoga olearia TBF 19.5.1]MDI3523654.1 hydrogenase-4 component [Kosmotoga sp.]MDK2953779.1 hydrogenase-4 component [Kosmotoga sp.]OAA23165.1 4Fe-4S ferredoxin [Kosmotoga sp. DU53]